MNRYAKYKDSGIDWLGEVPEHWEMNKIKRVAGLKSGDSITSSDIDQTGDYPVYGGNGLRGYTSSFTHEGHYVLIGRQGALCGNINYASGQFWASEHAVVSTLHGDHSVRWFGELLRSMNLRRYSQSAAQPGISVGKIENLKIPVPPLDEQRALAAYLDRKTQQIDTLVAKKERLIELLEERRTAVINRAVTKGLDPDAPMQDSGIDWLGEVPAHWEMVRLKHISKIRYGLGQPPQEDPKGTPFIRATNVNAGTITKENLVTVDPTDVPQKRDPILREKDIIVVRSGAYTGDSAIVPKKYDGAIAGYDMIVRVETAVPEYVAYSLLSPALLENQIFLFRMRAAQPHLNAEELGKTVVLLPPAEEQKQIIEQISSMNAEIDSLIRRETVLIEKLQELRTSLISEVVTGKIDVRGEAGAKTSARAPATVAA